MFIVVLRDCQLVKFNQQFSSSYHPRNETFASTLSHLTTHCRTRYYRILTWRGLTNLTLRVLSYLGNETKLAHHVQNKTLWSSDNNNDRLRSD